MFETRGKAIELIPRLTTIRNADLIVALKDGKVNEMGTHEELMKRRGLYYDLVESQGPHSIG